MVVMDGWVVMRGAIVGTPIRCVLDMSGGTERSVGEG